MNTNTHRLLLLAVLLSGLLSAQSSRSATATKQASGTDLTGTAAGVWSGGGGANGSPSAADIATWINTSLGAGLTLGAPASWGGIYVSGAASDIDITGAGALTLGGGGINMATSTVSLTLANSVAASTNQQWLVNGGRGLTHSGGVSGGYTMSANGLTYWSFLPASATVVCSNMPIASVVRAFGTMGGTSINSGTPVMGTPFYFYNNGTTATYQLQVVDGTFTKCVKVQVAQTGADLTAYVVYAKYNSGSTLGYNFDNGGTVNTIATAPGAGGYGAAITVLGVGGTATYNSYLPASPTTATVFPNTPLSSVTGAGGTMAGGWLIGTWTNTVYHFTNDGATASYQLQLYDGTYTKCAKVQLTQSGSDILGTQVYAKYKSGNVMGQNFDVIAADGAPPIGSGGYGVPNSMIILGGATGTVTLSGTNTFTGATAIGGGRLVVGGTGSLGGGTYAGTILNFGGLTHDSTAAQTLSGSIQGFGSLLKSSPSTLSLSAANTFTGPTVISRGTISLTGSGTLGSSAITLNDANTGTNTTALISDRTATFANAITVTNLGTGTSIIGSSGATFYAQSYSGTITLRKNVTLQARSADRTSITGRITGTGNITIDPVGTSNGRITLDNAGNDFLGNLTVLSPGILQFNGTTVIPDASDITNNGTIKLNCGANNSEFIGGLSGAGTVQIHEGVTGPQTLAVGGGGRSGSFSGTINNGANNGQPLHFTKAGTGTQTLSGALNFTGTTTVTNGILRLVSPSAFASSGVTVNTPGLLELTNASGAWNFNKAITGSGGLTKNGAGTVILSVTQNYSGPTTVGGGKLFANAALNASSSVSVSSGATYGGTGSAGSVTVADGGAVEGGHNGTGALSLASLTFSGAGSIGVTVADAATPLVISGTLTRGASLPITINILNGTQPAAGTYHILQFGALAGAADFVLPPSRAYSLQTNGNYLDLVVAAVVDFPIWTAANNSEWSLNTIPSPKNWRLNSDNSETDFLTADNVVFDDTASNSLVSLLGPLAPSAVTLNNTALNFVFGGAGSLAAGPLNKTGTGTVLFTNAGSLAFSGGMSISGGSVTLANAGANTFGSLNLDGGSLTLANTIPNTYPAAIGLTNGTLTFAQSVDFSLTANLSGGNGSVVKRGNNTLTLNAASSYTGDTIISQGSLLLAANGAYSGGFGPGKGTIYLGDGITGAGEARLAVQGQLAWPPPAGLFTQAIVVASGPSGRLVIARSGGTYAAVVSGPITLNNNLILRNDNGVDRLAIEGKISGVGHLTIEGNRVNIDNTNDFLGNVTLAPGGILQLNGVTPIPSGADVTNRGTFSFNANIALSATIAALSGDGVVNSPYGGGVATLALGATNYDGTVHDGSFSGSIQGNVALVKIGPGTQILGGANTFTGPTTLSNGTLLVNGSLAAGSAVTVTAGATLGGQGTINGVATVQTGATLKPGQNNETATLSLNKNLNLGGTASFVLNRTNAQNSSRVAGISTLTKGGALVVINVGPAPQLGDTFTLFAATNSVGSFTSVSLPPLDPGLAWSTTDEFTTLTVTAPTAPAMVLDPQSRTVLVGGQVEFFGTASGSQPQSYQWLFNEAPLSGETNRTLRYAPVQSLHAGNYRLVVTNEAGSVTSTIATLTVTVPAAGSLASEILADSPLGYWRLGESSGLTAFDSFGLNDGTYSNATLGLPGALVGDANTAVDFEPTNDSRVTIANPATFDFSGTTPFTLEAWINLRGLPASAARLFTNRRTPASGGAAGYGFGIVGTNTLRFTAYGIVDANLTVGTFATNQWYHLACVRSGTTVQFYLNGLPVGSPIAVSSIAASGQPLQLGRNPQVDLGEEEVQGRIDEAVVFNSALSASRIAAHYSTGLGRATNNAPVAGADDAGATQNQPLVIATVKLLANDTDIDEDALTLLGVSNTSTNGGTVSLAGGNVTYTPVANFVGTDLFTYTITDGYAATATGSVIVSVSSTNEPSLNVVFGPIITNSSFLVRFAGVPGLGYTVEFTDSLSPPAWTKSTNMVAPASDEGFGAGVFQVMEPTGVATQRFYRTVWPSY